MIESTSPLGRSWTAWRRCRFRHVVYRNYKVWRKTMLSSLVTHLAEPLTWLVGLGFGLGGLMPPIAGLSYLEFFGSGMLCYSAMNSASFESLWSAFTRLKVQRTWEAMLNTPMTVTDIVIGEWLSAALKGVLSGAAILLVMLALGLLHSWLALWALPVALLTGLAFSSCALVVTALARSFDFFNFYFNLILMPMMLISGVFFPADQLPRAVQWVAQLFPLVHATSLARSLLVGAPLTNIALHVLVITAYAVAGCFLANQLIRRRLTR